MCKQTISILHGQFISGLNVTNVCERERIRGQYDKIYLDTVTYTMHFELLSESIIDEENMP